MNIGKILTDLRKSKGLSRFQVANITNINIHTLIKYESNQTTPPCEKLVQLADFYNVSVDYLLGREIKNNDVDISIQYKDKINKIQEYINAINELIKEIH